MRTNKLDEDVLQRVLVQIDNNISISAIRTLLNAETGSNLSAQQLRKLRSSMVIDGTGVTPAERLMTYLRDADDIRYVAIIASRNRESLITIRTSKKDRYTSSESALPEDNMQDLDDNPKTYAQQAMQALTLHDGAKLLLGVAWVTEEGT